MGVSTHKSYCRFCHAYCAMEVDVEDRRAVAVRGDPSNPMYGGYTCIKGRQLPDRHNGPERIRRALKRQPDGSFEEISTARALDEIALRMQEILRESGPRSIASYCGSYTFQNSAGLAVAKAFHKAIGSPSFYTSVTIDQPAKYIVPARAGMWGGGLHGFEDADVSLSIGNNPIVSQFAPFGGLPPFNPVRRLQLAQKRGHKLIVIDPRRTDMARRAHLHLQLRPGEDPTLLAAMLRVILDEGLEDREFCARYTRGLDVMREAIADYTPEYAAARAGVRAEQIVEAARLFAAGPRGAATTGTGPDMAPHPNLAEHLALCLNIVCGRFNREGEVVPNPGVLEPGLPRIAQVFGPSVNFDRGERARVRGLGRVFGEMPTATLADEILEPGEGQVRALLSIGGNPVVAWPNQSKVVRALEEIDLHVALDVELSASARMAHYVLPPTLSLERADVTLLTDAWYEAPYSHYTEAVVPADPECLEEWEVYWELARRMGVSIPLAGGALDLAEKPTKHEVLTAMLPRTRIPLDRLRAADGGQVYPEIEITVGPGDPDSDARFVLDPDGVAAELCEVRAERFSGGGGYGEEADAFSHRLVSRRLRHVFNSSGRHLPSLRAKGTTNPAYMHPDDLEELGLRGGDIVEIRSAHASVLGVAEAAPDVRPGVISMAHAWGDPGTDPKEVAHIGSSTNALVDDETDYDPISGMARQSAIPVNVSRVELP